jgi:hypothetical protein
MLVRRIAEEAGELVGDVEGLVALEHRDTREHRQFLDQLRRGLRLAGVAADQDRVLGGEKLVGKLGDHRRIGAASLRLRELVGGVAADLVARPPFGQRLALRHQIDRPARMAFHDRVGAAQCLLHHDAGRQRPFPLHVGPHQRALVDRFLDEMNVGVAGADQLVARRIRRLARHQQHRQPRAEQVMHRVGGVGGSDVDMHQNGLAAAGDRGVAHRHVRGGILVRA